LDLSLNLKVPTGLLILSRAFRLMPHQTPEDLFFASIQHMPKKVTEEVEVEVELSTIEPTDLRAKLEILKEERQKVYEEKVVEKKEIETNSESVENLRPEEKKVSQVGDFIAEMAAPCEDEKQEIETIEQEMKHMRKERPSTVEVDSIEKKLERMLQSLEEEVRKAEAESQRLLDLDYDGRLTCDELIRILDLAGLKEEESKEFVAKLDLDKDGYVDVEHVKRLRKLDINIDSLKSAHIVQDEDAKKRAELYRKVKQFQKESIQ